MLLFGNISIYNFLAIGFVLLLGMGLHEYAHAVVADYWGDPTPRQQGRLTPNPMVHINWVGWIMFVLIGFGILGSVPINKFRMRDPRWGSFWTSFAGPLSNLGQALIYAVTLRILDGSSAINAGTGFRIFSGIQGVGSVGDLIALTLSVGVLYNVLLFVFNLLPLFPMDGWHMMLELLPGRGMEWGQIPLTIRQSMRPLATFLNQPAYKWEQWAQMSQYAFFVMIMISFAIPQLSPFSMLIGTPTRQITLLLLGA